MLASFLTPEFLSLIGGSLTGFIFKNMAEQREARRQQFEMLIKKNETETANQDKAVQRVGVEAGKIVRRVIVLCVLFGTIVAPFVLPFFGIPTNGSIKAISL